MALGKVMRLARSYSGMRDQGALTDADLIVSVNDYYRFELPDDCTIDEFYKSLTFATVAGQSSYPIPENVISLSNPRLVEDNYPLFSDINPFDQFVNGQDIPQAAVTVGRKIYFNPTPDYAYLAQFVAYTRPDALTFVNDELARDDLDELVAVGTAKLLLNRIGDVDRAGALENQFQILRAKAMSGTYRNNLRKRAAPSF